MRSKLCEAQQRTRETTAESLTHLLTRLPGNLEQKTRGALADLDDDYALAVSVTDLVVISRNSLGTKPLYFGENNEFTAFASNKKSLWRIGLGEVELLPILSGYLIRRMWTSRDNLPGTSVLGMRPGH